MSDTDEWAAPRGAVALGVTAALVLAAWAATAADPPGRLLVGIAAVAVLVASAVGAVARPRLAAGPDGLTLRGLRGRRRWPWPRVDAVRVVRMRRLGLPAAYVEVDARDDDGTERLLVLGRLELGTDPVEVAASLQEHRARAGRAPREPDGSDERHRPDRDGQDEHRGDGPGDAETHGGA